MQNKSTMNARDYSFGIYPQNLECDCRVSVKASSVFVFVSPFVWLHLTASISRSKQNILSQLPYQNHKGHKRKPCVLYFVMVARATLEINAPVILQGAIKIVVPETAFSTRSTPYCVPCTGLVNGMMAPRFEAFTVNAPVVLFQIADAPALS